MRLYSSNAFLLAFLLMSALCTGAARAADGVVEINQARALAGGITPRDESGFPVTISVPGSYRLTSNLFVPPNLSAIDITADGVTLDLNGFEVVGPVSCSPSCPSPIPVAGILSSGNRIHVRNGTVRGFGGWGVFFAVFVSDNRVDHVYVTSNAADGIFGREGMIVEGSIAVQNGAAGISVGSNSLVQGCMATGNVSAGISTSGPAVVVGNAVSSNGANGIDAAAGSVIRENAAIGNSDGISADGGLVTQNVAAANVGNGIRVFVGGLANENVVNTNSASGIVADSGSSVQGNTAYSNALDGFNFRLVHGTDPPGCSEI